MGGGGASRARSWTSAPDARFGGTASLSNDTRTRGGNCRSSGRIDRRVTSLAARSSTCSTRPETFATIGRWSLGDATHSARAQINAQPKAVARANQPSAAPLRPLPNPKPARLRLTEDTRPRPTDAGRQARTRPQSQGQTRRPTRAEAGHAPPRAAFPAARESRKTASSNSPEHAVEEALPLC